MVVTHLFQILAFTAMEAPTVAGPAVDHRGEEQGLPVDAADPGRRRRARAVRRLPLRARRRARARRPRPSSPCKCYVDNWRWAGVPFYLRTGKKLAEGQRIISIAFKEPPQSMFPEGSGIGMNGPDHLTFDLADQGKMALSFYGKRPGPGLPARQALHAVRRRRDGLGRLGPGGLRAADPRRRQGQPHAVHDRRRASSGCGRSPADLLADLPPVRPYAEGSWGPNQIHQLIAPRAWRLPFERTWREKG